MTNARIIVAIEEILGAATGALSFTWHESREDGGLEISCTPAAPDWVELDDREGWELAHGLDVWVPGRERAPDQLRGEVLGRMLSEAIRAASDADRVRANLLAGLAA